MLAIHDDVFSEDGVQRDVSSSILQLALADIHEEDLKHLRAKHDALILLALCAVYDGGYATRTIYLNGLYHPSFLLRARCLYLLPQRVLQIRTGGDGLPQGKKLFIFF